MPRISASEADGPEISEIAPPGFGEMREIESGLWWLRLPLPMALDHVNIYLFDEGASWTVIDTGIGTDKCISLWQALLDGPLQEKPVARVIVTHHHPDHIGLAGWFQARGAELIIGRTAWLIARMLVLDTQERPSAAQLAFWRRAGMAEEEVARRARQRPFNMSDVVHPLPIGIRSIGEGDQIEIGGARWHVHLGQGHAQDHLTFWREDGRLVLMGDQCLAHISPNIGVYATEPEANPLRDWLASCQDLAAMGHPETLILPGHGRLFYGVAARMAELRVEHEAALDRLREWLVEPRTVLDCFAPLYRREIRGGEFSLALAEAKAHVNYLAQTGEIVATPKEGREYWQKVED